jgi:hypothetical protein
MIQHEKNKESTDITLVTNEECFVMDMGIVMVFC